MGRRISIQIKHVLSWSHQKIYETELVRGQIIHRLVYNVPLHSTLVSTTGGADHGGVLHGVSKSRTGASTRSKNGCIVWWQDNGQDVDQWIALLKCEGDGYHPASLILIGLLCASSANEKGENDSC